MGASKSKGSAAAASARGWAAGALASNANRSCIKITMQSLTWIHHIMRIISCILLNGRRQDILSRSECKCNREVKVVLLDSGGSLDPTGRMAYIDMNIWEVQLRF